MIERKSLLYVMETLTVQNNYKLAQQILDSFFTLADCTADYDTLGEAALKTQHHSLRFKCAENLLFRAKSREALFNARENLYKSYNAINYPEKALFYIDQNLKVKPDDHELILERAFNLSLLGKKDEAEEIIDSVYSSGAIESEQLEYLMADRLLRSGQTSKGILSFIDTFKPKNRLFEDKLKLKFWSGETIPGATIVVNGEGGVGDELINIRFLDTLKERGMHPILYSSWHMYRPDTVDIFLRHGYEVTTTPLFFKKDYYWTHMMSLPGYLGLTEQQLWRGTYLKPLRDPKNKLNDKKFKIGFKCSGNPYFEQDVYRSIPVDQMLSIMPEEASVYSFDMENTHNDTISLKDDIKNWDDTLDYLDQMDIVVSSCTSLVHAAGAIGKRTIVCVPIAKYYIWTSTRTNQTTPWYGDNMSVLQQTTLRSWNEPLLQAKKLIDEEIDKFLLNK